MYSSILDYQLMNSPPEGGGFISVRAIVHGARALRREQPHGQAVGIVLDGVPWDIFQVRGLRDHAKDRELISVTKHLQRKLPSTTTRLSPEAWNSGGLNSPIEDRRPFERE